MAELSNEIPRNSAFHPDNIGPAALVTLLHIKDYLNVIAGNLDPEATDMVQNLHEKGQFLCPPPLSPVAVVTEE